jgi:hypothetical protein
VGGDVVTEEAEITAAWLTEVLFRAGALEAGRVETVTFELAGASWSRNARLRLGYSEASSGERPERLFLKICAGPSAVFGPSEVHYYTRDYLAHPGAPLPRCYDAAYRAEPRAYHVLLADLSATHVDGFQVEPGLEMGRSVADALARLHTAHWGAAARVPAGPAGGAGAGEGELERYFGWIEPGLAPLLAAAGDALAPAGRAVLERVFGRHRAAMRRRAQRPAGLTLVHGDTNPGNLLFPRRAPGPVYVIDRQPFDWSLQCWLAASDLAILMVLHWEVEPRRALELPVLRAYREALSGCGVEYSWDELFWDYRFSVAQCLEFAVEWCVLPKDRTGMRWLWERQLHRSLAAWDDLGCDELLPG